MKINYKILQLDNTEHSMVVRYYTDILTEEVLTVDTSQSNRNPDGSIIRCKTDYHLNFWVFPATEEQIIAQIKASAPVLWLQLREYTLGNDRSLDHVAHMVGSEGSFECEPPKAYIDEPEKSLTEEEIEELLKKLQ